MINELVLLIRQSKVGQVTQAAKERTLNSRRETVDCIVIKPKSVKIISTKV